MKIKKTFKEAFGKNPWDPWSTKANITEDGLLDRYLLSRGLNPSTVSKDMKIAHSKSNQFKQWAANQKEEVEIDDNLIEASTGQLHRYLMSRGLDPMHVSKDSKIAHAKSNQFKQWAMSQAEEIEEQMTPAHRSQYMMMKKLHTRSSEIKTPRGPGRHSEETQNEDHIAIAMGRQLDDEGSMVLNQLDMLEDAIKELRDVVKDPKMQLPAWVQSKITLAADYMDTVSHYMSSRNEEEMNEAASAAQQAAIAINMKKKGIKPKNEEVEQLDELKTGTLMRYSTKANQALVGGDRNKEDRRIQSINRAIQKIKSRYSKPAGDIQVDVKNKKITKNEEVVLEMDKSQKPPGRDGGDEDAGKKQIHLGPEKIMKPKAVAKSALKILQKHYKKSTQKEEVDLEEGSLHDWFGKEKWVRMDTKGNIKGQCAKEPGEGKPKCLPQAKAHALGKEGRAKAAQRKRREDPHAERSGKAINVRTEETAQIDEKKDACYHKVKSRYKVWPSAYASGALVKCRKAGAKNWGNKSEENELNESLVKKVVASAALAAAAASPHAHAQDKEPTQHPSNPHLIAHVEHGNKVSRFDLEKMFKSHEDATEHMTKALKKHGITNHIMHITNKHNEDELPTYAAKHKDYMDKTPAIQKVSHSDYSDNKPYVAKRSDKNYMSTESVSDKLHSQHQALRKKSGLPHPDYYKELGKSYDISDDKERMAKQSEIKKKYSVESVLYDDPKGTLTRVSERKKELSRSARIIKALYKKKGMKEDTYDWEKDDKSTSSYGKKPKMSVSDDKASRVKKESDAAAVLSGGTTLTKQKRDIVELDPRMKLRPNKDAQDADDNNTN